MIEVEPIEHLGHFGAHPTEWRLGTTCDECDAGEAAKKAALNQGAPMALLHRMREYEYRSVNEMQKEAVAEARANGIEPEYAR